MRKLFFIFLLCSTTHFFGQEQFPLSDIYTPEDKKINLESVINKLTIIDLWATWCKPCIKESPYLDKIKEAYGDKIDIIYISLDTDKEKWKKYLSEKPGDLQFWAPQDSPILKYITEVFASGGSSWSIPKFFLLDKNGKKVSRYCPYPSSGKLESFIEQNL